MKPRLIASVALGAVVLLGTSGCAMISTQATTISYSPGDGANVPDSGPLQVRNVVVVSEGDGAAGNLVAAIVNDTDRAETLNIEFGEGSAAQTTTVRVPARTTVSLGSEEEPPLPLEKVPGAAGSTIPMYFQSGDAEGVLQQVPVLDGELDYYGELIP